MSTLSGYAAVFDEGTLITWEGGRFEERIAPGAFRFAVETAPGNTLFVRDHDPSLIIGRVGAGTTIAEDSKGLAFVATMPETTLATDTATLVRDKILKGMSFAFTVGKDGEELYEEKGGTPVRVITKVGALFDICVCSRPAYAGATVTATRADPAHAVQYHLATQKLTRLQTDLATLAGKPPTSRTRPLGRRVLKPGWHRPKALFRRGCGHCADFDSEVVLDGV
jgi:HK97 family phage prohead protease